MKLFAYIAILFCVLLPSSSFADVGTGMWENNASHPFNTWAHRINLTIDHTKLSADLTDFPVFVDLSLMPAAFHNSVRSDAGDIRITKSDGITEVPREIVSYDSVAKTGEVYFKASGTLSSTVDTSFYVYYGNSAVGDYSTNATYGATNVWDSDAKGVWHLSGNALDSTSNSNNGILVNGPTWTTGKFGGASGFDGVDDYVDLANTNLGDAFTVSSWVKPVLTGSMSQMPIYCETTGNNDSKNHVFINSTTKLFGFDQYKPTGGTAYSSTIISENVWYFITAVQSAQNSRAIYINGVLESSSVETYSGSTPVSWSIGRRLAGLPDRFFHGSITDVRLYNRTVSPSWITGQFANQNSPNTFYALSPVEAQASTISGTITDGSNPLAGVSVSAGALGSTTTAANGTYSFASVPHGTAYTLTPSKTGYTFAPTSASSTLTADTTHNFTATLNTYTISGTVTDGSNPVPGVTVSAGGIGSTLTASDGTYSFTPISHGTAYTLTPTKTGYTFAPTSASATLTSAATHNFTGSMWNTNASHPLNAWGNRIKLTIDHTKLSADLTDFPVFVDLSLMPVAFHSSVRSDAGDIRITKSDGITEVPREIVAYNSVAKTGELYFKASGTLSSTVDTSFYVYYGNSAVSDYATDATYGAKNVWDSGAKGVWHLSGNELDSTSNGNDGTLVGGPTWTTGEFGGALGFNSASTQHVAISNTGIVGDKSAFTIAAWFKTVSVNQVVYAEGNSTANSFINNMGIDASGHATVTVRDGAYVNGSMTSSATYVDNTWHHLVLAQVSKSSRSMYVDGIEVGTSSVTVGTITTDRSTIGYLRRLNPTSAYTGIISDVRVYERAIPASWISTQYANQKNTETFYALSSVEEETSAISGTITDGSNPLAGVTVSAGALGSTTTAANGTYSFNSVSHGTAYTLTPSKTGYTFAPTTASSTLTSAATHNFTAALNTYTISGTITDGTNPLVGVTLSAGGLGSTITASDGTYSLTSIPHNTAYTLTPSKTGYTFAPTSASATLTSAATHNFTGSMWNTNASHPLNAWGNRIKLTIDHTKLSSDLTDFPVFVDLSLMPAAFHSSVRSDAGDIRITKSDGITEVPREIVAYNSLAKTGELYFKASGTLSSTVDTSFYVYYGNSAVSDYATDATYGAKNVWDSGAKGVWHLSGNALDSTSNGNNGTLVGGPTWTAGMAGGALGFDGVDDYVGLGDKDVFTFGNGTTDSPFSIGCWLKTTATGTNVVLSKSQYNVGWQREYLISATGGNITFRVMAFDDSFKLSDVTNGTINDGTWKHVTVTYTGSSNTDGIKIYVDGILAPSTPATAGTYVAMSNTSMPLEIGRQFNGGVNAYFSGSLADLHIYNRVLPLSWIATQEVNQRSPNTFYSLASVEEETSTISGTITVGGSPLAGATMSAGILGSTTTAADGTYSFASVPHNTAYTLTPSKTGYTFAPTSASSTLTSAATHNFTATLNTYNIGGTITDGSNPLAGVTVSAGALGSTTTAANGTYSFASVPHGTAYTLTPSKTGYTFAPTTASSNLTSAATHNFTAALNTYTISGTITDGSNPIAGFTVSAGGLGSTTTAADGTYSFASVPHGTAYTLTPTKTGYTFAPTSASSTLTSAATHHFTGSMWNTNASHPLNAWGHRIKLTIDNTKLSADLTDFPVFVDLSLMPVAFHSSVRSDAGDIRITKSDGITEVPREIVAYNSVAKTGELYFKASVTLSSTVDTSFYVYYGNSAVSDYATDATYGAKNVWDSGAKGVWHLSGNAFDSTSNGNDGTLVGGPTWMAGMTGGALGFDGVDDYVSMGNVLPFDHNQPFSIIVNFYPRTSKFEQFVSKYDMANYRGYAIGTSFSYPDRLTLEISNSSGHRCFVRSTSSVITYNTWQTIVGTYDGSGNASGLHIYKNGTAVPVDIPVDTLGTYTTVGTDPFAIGGRANFTDAFSDASINNILIYDRALSTTWILAHYANQNSPNTFYALSSVEQETSTISGTITDGANPLAGVTISAGILGSTTTAADGTYSFASVPHGTAYTLTTSKTGYTFAPTSVSSTLTSAATHNFTATLNTYNIGGTITDGSNPLAGVTVSAGGLGSTTTAADGTYSFASVPHGTAYTLTPTKTGYTFAPTSASSTLTSATTHNFTGSMWNTNASHPLNAWGHRIKITIDHTKLSADLTDFPVFVDLSLMPVAFHSSVRSDAGDIRITKSDGITEVPREIVAYNSVAKTGEVYFKASSTLSSTVDTSFYVYYGNSAVSDYATDATYGAKNVWDSGAKGVWHLSGNALDSTSNGNNGTLVGGPTWTAGEFGGALGFDGVDDYINIGTMGALGSSLGNGLTISAWVKSSSASSMQSIVGTIGPVDSTYQPMLVSINRKSDFSVSAGAINATLQRPSLQITAGVNTDTGISNGDWHHISVTILPGTRTVSASIDGIPRTVTHRNQDTLNLINFPVPLFVGATYLNGSYSQNLQGSLAEVRIYNYALSAPWISAQYANQKNTETFYALSSVEEETSTISGTVTVVGSPLTGVTISAGILGSTTTAADGTYSFASVPHGTAYTLTPSKTGYTFAPTSASSTLTSAATHNFTATLNTYNIGGTITDGSNPLAGVTVSAGALGSTTTASNGTYSFGSVPHGTAYTLTPSKTGYTFAPTSASSTLTSAATHNFTAALNTYTISGTITDGSNPLAGVTVSAGALGSTTTAANGTYSFASIPHNTAYTLTPSKTGYTFAPTSASATLTSATTQNFTGSMWNTNASHPLNAWGNRIKLTIDHTKLSADLTDFPVFVDLSLMPAAFHSSVRSDAGDIRITKSDGITEVPREIVAYNSVAKTGELYFKASGTLSSTVDTSFYVYYGNSAVSDYATNATYGAKNVWDSGAKGVWHLSGNALDSTSNGNNGTLVGGPTWTAGEFGGAIELVGSPQEVLTSNTAILTGDIVGTWSVWFKAVSSDFGSVVMLGDAYSTPGAFGVFVNLGGSGSISAEFAGSNGYRTAPGVAALNIWHHAVVMKTQGPIDQTTKLYVDGVLIAPATSSTNTPNVQPNFPVKIGRFGLSQSHFKGLISDVRIYNRTLPASWISAQYVNQKSTETFYALSSVEEETSTISGTVTVGGSPLTGVTISAGILGLTTTAADGTYSFASVPHGTAYTLTPSKTGYTFAPTSASSTLTSATTHNFTATLNTYTISGTVTDGSNPLAGVTVSAGALGSTTTAADGTYSFGSVPHGTAYTLTPSKTGYTFAPTSASSTLTSAATHNFTATLNTYTISGTVTDGSNPLAGVTVSAGALGSTTTASDGTYSLTSIPHNTAYTLTPSKTGYTFAPTSASATLTSATTQNFTGSMWNTNASHPLNAWGNRIKLTIDHTKLSADLTDFPVFVDLSLMPAAFHSSLRSDAGDIRITKSDGITEVPREIVAYNSVAKTGELYFKASGTLSSTVDTSFYVYYGNSAVSDYATNATYGAKNVWDSGAKGVWHLSGNALDSTSNGNNGTLVGGPTWTAGEFGGALGFDGVDDYVQIPDHSGLRLVSGGTITAWIRPISEGGNAAGRIVDKGTTATSTSNGYALYTAANNRMGLRVNGGVSTASLDNSWLPGNWVFIVASIDNSGVRRIYADDVDVTGTSGDTQLPPNTTGEMKIGNRSNATDRTFNGTIADVRIYDSTLSAFWIAAQYANQKSTETFYSLSSVEEETSTINGTVTDGTNPIAGVTVSAGALGSTTTAADGTYSLASVPHGTAYTLTPSKTGYTFAPTSTSSTLTSAATHNFTATLNTYSIGGTVTDGSNPVPGLAITHKY